MSFTQYPNIKAVLYISFSFFILFLAFFSSANSASKALRECGFQNLGFYSLSILYLNFGVSSFWTPKIIARIGAKKSMIIASSTYGIWIISLALTSIALKSESLRESLSYEMVCFIVIIASLINGSGCSLLWIAQGKYLSDCAQLCLEKKGFYSSIFWTTMLSAQFLSSLLNAFVLGSFPQEYLFIAGAIIAFASTALMVFLPGIEMPQISHSQTINKKQVSIVRLAVDKRMILSYGMQLSQATSLAIRQGGLMMFISYTIQSDSVQIQYKYSSFASAMFGIGQLFGSTFIGYVNDKRGGGRSVAIVAIFIAFFAYLNVIIYNEIHEFGIYAFVVTFLIGMQDGYLQTQATIVLGFEFETNIEPFAVYRIVNSTGICIGMAILSQTTTKESYRIYFSICLVFTVVSQIIMAFLFTFQNKKTLQQQKVCDSINNEQQSELQTLMHGQKIPEIQSLNPENKDIKQLKILN